MRRLMFILAGLAAAGGAGLAQAGDLSVRAPTIRASIGRSLNTAAYMTIVNTGTRPDRLRSAACACAATVMVHKTEMTHGVTTMGDVADVVIPPGGAVRFTPEGLHLMITGLKAPLTAGGSETITLMFERAGAMKVAFAVKSSIEQPPMKDMPGM